MLRKYKICYKRGKKFISKEITRKQFEVLVLMVEAKESLFKRKIEEKIGCSLGTVNWVMKELTELK